MRRLAGWLARTIDGRDIVMVLGLGLLTAGLAMDDLSLALIVCGSILFLLAVVPPILATWRGP